MKKQTMYMLIIAAGLFLAAPALAGLGTDVAERPGEGEPLIVAPAPAGAEPVKTSAGEVAGKRERDPREVFARGNRLYEEGKYGEARAEYEKLIGDGYVSADLFYNLANACFKLDRKGEAILYYRKALALKPRDQDVKSNLGYALSLIEDRIEPASHAWIVRRWNGFTGYFNGKEFATTSVSLYWLLCAVLIAMVYLPAARKALARVSAALLLLIVISLAGALSRYRHDGGEQAVILSKESKVRYGPSENDVAAFVLHEGAVVRVENSRPGWCQISLPDGKAGWLKKDSIGFI